MGLRSDIINLAHELDQERDKMFMLWTWLPSYAAAQEHHGDYASEFMPNHVDILIEATMYLADISTLLGGRIKLTAAQLENGSGYYTCPCDEDYS